MIHHIVRKIIFAALLAVPFLTAIAQAAPVNLALTTGASNKLDLGFFSGGTALNLTFTGNGDMVDLRFATLADGSLSVPASGIYSFANAGASYPAVAGGDGINHYVGGGAAYDYTGSGFPFAGVQSTDSTNPATIRFGTVVGTFATAPTRADWFYVGNGATITTPAGGANLYLAVNDTNNTDNHGTYIGNLVVVPEAGTASLLATAGIPLIIGGIICRYRKCS